MAGGMEGKGHGSGESHTEEYMDLVTTMGHWGSIPWGTWRDCVDSSSEMSAGRPKRGRAPRHVSSWRFQGASRDPAGVPGQKGPGGRGQVLSATLHAPD